MFGLFVLVTTIQAQTWMKIGSDIDGVAAGDNSGYSVSLSGDGSIVAIGAPNNDENGDNSGQVRVFANNNGVWTQIGADILGEANDDNFGYSVSLNANGTVLAVGSPNNDGNGTDAGRVRVFKNVSGSWTQMGQSIDGEDGGDNFGTSVSLNDDGSIVAIGSPYNDDNASTSGSVRVYKYNSTLNQWEQIGQDIDGENSGDVSGTAVSLSGDGNVVVIGAPYNDENGSKSGQVRVFAYNSSSNIWEQKGQSLYGENQYYEAGTSVSVNYDGSVIAMGIPRNDDYKTEAGEVKIFGFDTDNGQWVQLGQNIYGESSGDYAGYSVSLNTEGDFVAIGSKYNGTNGDEAGQVRVFQYVSETGIWIQVGSDINGEAENDNFGCSVSLSGDGMTVAAGSCFNDGNGVDAGHVRVYRFHPAVVNDVDLLTTSVYPNPTNGDFAVEIKNIKTGKTTFELYDVSGTKVYEIQLKGNVNHINTSLPDGVYYYKVLNGKQSVALGKILIKH